MGNSGVRARNQSGTYLESNRKYKRKCEEHEIKKNFKKSELKTREKGSERRVGGGGGSKGYMQKPNESKPKGTHNTRVEAQVTLSARRRRAEAR